MVRGSKQHWKIRAAGLCSHLKKKEEKTRVKELWKRCTDETAQVLWTQNILLLIYKSLQSPKRQQQKSSRYLVSISQTDKWHLSLTKHKHVPQPRGKMFLKLSTSIHWKNYSTSFPQTAFGDWGLKCIAEEIWVAMWESCLVTMHNSSLVFSLLITTLKHYSLPIKFFTL